MMTNHQHYGNDLQQIITSNNDRGSCIAYTHTHRKKHWLCNGNMSSETDIHINITSLQCMRSNCLAQVHQRIVYKYIDNQTILRSTWEIIIIMDKIVALFSYTYPQYTDVK